jgi:hypothetical protein
MGTIDIDTAYSISNASRLLSIISPFIDDNFLKESLQTTHNKHPENLEELTDVLTEKLGKTLKININQPLIRRAFSEIVKDAANPRTISMMKPYHAYHELLLDNFATELSGRLIYIVSGSSISPGSQKVEGNSPLSYSFMTTTSLLELLEQVDDSILDKVAFIFPQPIIQTLIPREDSQGLFLEDIIASESEQCLKLLPQGHLMTIEDMRKRLDNTTRRSLWHYNPGIFKPKQAVTNLLEKNSKATPNDMQVEKKKPWIARRMLGYAMAQLLATSFEDILESLDHHKLSGIPIFAPRTSYTADILDNHANKFNNSLIFDFVGEYLSTGKQIPVKGVNEQVALNKLSGHIQRTLGPIVLPSKRKIQSISGLELRTEQEYPHILLEMEALGTRPSIITLYDSLTRKKNSSYSIIAVLTM